MMMMTMKERPIGKRSQTSVGAAFIGWCFKSGIWKWLITVGVVQYHRALGTFDWLPTRYIQFCHTRLPTRYYSTPLRYTSRNFGSKTAHYVL